MSNLTDYAERLAKLYVEIRSKQVLLSHQEQDLAACELTLTPAEGWPGKNEEARSTARSKAFAEAETHLKIRVSLAKLRDELAALQGEIDAQEVLFKAARWQIRQETNDVLRARRIQPDPEDGEHDDPGDVTGAVSEAAVEGAVYADGDDDGFPF